MNKKHINPINKKRIITLCILFSIIIVLFFASLFIGASGMSFSEVIKGLFGQADNNKSNIIMQNIRLPRLVGALIAGAGLAASGMVMQTNLNNSMAAPSTLGVTNAAVLGANIAIIILSGGVVSTQNGTSFTINNYYLVTFFAFAFALAATLIVLGLSKIRSFNTTSVILVGVGLSALFTAITSLIQYFATDVKLSAAVYWSFGDLGRVTNQDNLFLFIVLMICLFAFMFLTPSYNALLGGDDLAKSLGIKTDRIRLISLGIASLLTAAIVSFFGIIGFIGIMAPHIMRRILGNDQRFLLPSSMMMGIIIVMFSDMISRLIMQGTSLPVGAITSIIGAPFFIFIIFFKDERRNYAKG